MPRIRSVSAANDVINVTDSLGTHTFNASTIPIAQNTITKVEAWLNTVGLPAITDGEYQIQVHVNGISPLRVSIITAYPNVIIPANWWVQK